VLAGAQENSIGGREAHRGWCGAMLPSESDHDAAESQGFIGAPPSMPSNKPVFGFVLAMLQIVTHGT